MQPQTNLVIHRSYHACTNNCTGLKSCYFNKTRQSDSTILPNLTAHPDGMYAVYQGMVTKFLVQSGVIYILQGMELGDLLDWLMG